jgi:hypothetical protein
MAGRQNPFGDGTAAEKIAGILDKSVVPRSVKQV